MRFLCLLIAAVLAVSPARACKRQLTPAEEEALKKDEERFASANRALLLGKFELAFNEASSCLGTGRPRYFPNLARIAGLAALKLDRYADAVHYLETAVLGDPELRARLEEARIRMALARGRRLDVDVVNASVFTLENLRRYHRVPEADSLVALARGHEALGEHQRAQVVWRAIGSMFRDQSKATKLIERYSDSHFKEVDRSPSGKAYSSAPSTSMDPPAPCEKAQ